ncbi:hypothetical protein [Chitinophaga barathri]|uniref:Uncharacterized protein n=1 Tax=Chitinophaga barathri TaxID=1647451 RepID=A0A3N4MD20_9BACT|nr:hypothetical protein [Chitinophaga barathri]RPD41774.1 hypothetical protein EG028_06295 [Chitinophaga barathri]
MIQLEEIALGGLFYRDKKVMQIREEHFGDLLPLLPRLEPIPIDPQRLWKLGFSRYVNTGVSYKDWQGVRLYLRPATLNRWLVQFEGIPKAGFVQYIHQVQRLWFDLFQEHLFQPPQARVRQRHVIPEADVSRRLVKDHAISHYKRYETTITPPSDQPYYFTWDCRILFRTGQVAAWRVDEKSPLFTYAGRNWGLTLLSGTATEEERIKAGKWLKGYLEERG